MGIAERKIRQKAEVRSSILEAAWEMVQQDGWQALSIRKIAEAIEYSVPVIYEHFENKEAILLEFTQRGLQLLNEELARTKALHVEADRQLEEMAFAYWRFALGHKEYYQLIYGIGMPSCEMVRSIPELGQFTGMVITSIRALIEKYGASKADPYLKLHTFWSMLHGLISITMLGKNSDEESGVLVLQDFMRGFISGIKSQE